MDLRDLWRALAQAGWPAFFGAVSLFLVVRVVTAAQLYEGVKALRLRLSFRAVLRVQLIASFYSLALPGDLAAGGVSWYRLSRESGKVYEIGLLLGFYRILNTFVLIVLGAVAGGLDLSLANSQLRTVILLLLILVASLMLPFFFRRTTAAAKSFLRPVLTRLPAGVAEKVDELESAARLFAGTHTPGSVALAVFLSLAHHLLGVWWMFELARAFDLGVSIFVVGWIRTLLALAQMIPATVAGLGVREVSLVFLLGAYGVPQAQALAYSLGVFVVNLAGGLAGGIVEAWHRQPPRSGGTIDGQDVGRGPA